MFQKSQRLRNNEEVLKTIKKGVNLKTPFFNVKYLENKNNFENNLKNTFKITVVVSKKISKLAVNRNRIKRIFRAEIKNFLNKKNKENPKFQLKWNFVFFPFKNTLEKKSSDLKNFIEKIFEKIL